MSHDTHGHRFNLTPVIPQVQLAAQIQHHGKLISQHYAGVVGELVVCPVLTGALFFTADLLRFVKMPLRIEPVRISTYRGETKHVAPPTCADNLSWADGRHVLVVEDILDTGTTLAFLVNELRKAGALSVEVCVLLRKQGTQTAFVEEPRWVLFNLPNAFVVGYGLDLEHHHRHMPFISVVTPRESQEKKVIITE